MTATEVAQVRVGVEVEVDSHVVVICIIFFPIRGVEHRRGGVRGDDE